MTEAVKIDGLTQFSKAIKDIDATLPKTLRLALNATADVVITATHPLIPTLSGKARASVKAQSTKDRVKVVTGGKRAPHYPWLDYGGEGRIKGRPAKRTFIKSGRYLYPTYFKKRDSGEFKQVLTGNLLGVVRAAGIEVD